jgi:hypothetical protein
MKLVASLRNFIVGLAVFTATFASAFQFEGGFQPSPNGQYVASVVNSGLAIPIPTEGLELSASVAVRIRDPKGKELFSVSVARARKLDEIGYGHVSTIWSPDSQTLAYCNQGNLSVVGVGNHEPHKLLQSVSSFRWVGNSNLCCVTGPLEDDGLFSVTEIPVRGGGGITRLTNLKAHAFHPCVSEHHNQLSPDSRNVVFIDGAQILISSLRDTNKQKAIQRKLTPSFCWWNDTGERCLVHGLETVKTTKAWPEDTTFRDVLYLYATNDATFTDLTDNLRQSNNDPNLSPPRPMAEDRVWSPEGGWFLASDWICVPKPWRSVHIREVLGKDFHNPKVAPFGSKFGIISAPNEYARTGDLYVIEIQVGTEDKPVLCKPQKITSGTANSWFWSADGKQLVVWDGRKFTYYPIAGNP